MIADLLPPKGLLPNLLERARHRDFELCLSPEILAETRHRLINYQHLRKRYNYSDDEVAYFVGGLRFLSTRIADLPKIKVVRDPNDDFVLATAIKAKADYLVVRDNDLLVLETLGTQVVSPEQFEQVLKVLPVMRIRQE